MDQVNHPPHYNGHPSGVEAIDICECLTFSLGNALKYVWRAKHKGIEEIDLQKALWYLEREERAQKIDNSTCEIDDHVRFNVQKVLDNEESTSMLGKFLAVFVTIDVADSGINRVVLRKLMEIVTIGVSSGREKLSLEEVARAWKERKERK